MILLAGVLAYSNALSGPFIFDDAATIVQNEQIRDLGSLRVLSPPKETPVAGRPLVNLSLAINYALGRLDVGGYHVVNLALHLACALLIFGLIRRTLKTIDPPVASGTAENVSLAAALLWTVHPLNSEVVNYVTQRTESTMAVCYLLTLYASVRALDPSRRRLWQAVSVVVCFAGMACKETMVTAPLMVLLYDRVYVFESLGRALRSRGRFYGGLAASWLLLAALVASNGQTLSSGFATAQTSPWTYLLNQTVILTQYLWLTIWPQALVIYYGWPVRLTAGDVWPYALLIVAFLVATIVTLARRPRVGFLCAWAFLTLAPTSSLLPIATEVGAERRMYLPLAGLITLAMIGLAAAWNRTAARRSNRPIASSLEWPVTLSWIVLVLAVSLAARTAARNREYASALTMARTVLARWPTANGHYLVGAELASLGQHAEAIVELRAATGGYAPARYLLGSELLAIGQVDDSIDELQRFIREEPNLLAARSAHGLLANALAGRKGFDLAIPHYRAYLDANAGDANAWTGLGIALVTTGRGDEAISAFRRATAADPANRRFRLNLARALLDRGALDEASAIARQIPDDPAAHDIQGRVLALRGKFDEARRELELALRLDPSYAPAIEALRALPGKR